MAPKDISGRPCKPPGSVTNNVTTRFLKEYVFIKTLLHMKGLEGNTYLSLVVTFVILPVSKNKNKVDLDIPDE